MIFLEKRYIYDVSSIQLIDHEHVIQVHVVKMVNVYQQKLGTNVFVKNDATGILCEQKAMPQNYRWCPVDCRAGTNCVYEGNTPKCRAL